MKEDDTRNVVAAGRLDQVVDDGAVQITIALARPIVMSVAQVEALHSGSVIELGLSLGQAQLSVQVGERLIATGRFVVLDEGGAAVSLSQVRL
jgi:flagellar motor switch/type III secretory pathway protein FliN